MKCILFTPFNFNYFSNINPKILLHEAEFYGVGPLVKRLVLCEELNDCPSVLFHGTLPAPKTAFCRQTKVSFLFKKCNESLTIFIA